MFQLLFLCYQDILTSEAYKLYYEDEIKIKISLDSIGDVEMTYFIHLARVRWDLSDMGQVYTKCIDGIKFFY